MKSKFTKKEVCPKCGREQHGFYINPICLCGHQLRKLNGWETSVMGYSEKEFQTLSTERKREVVRNIEWNWCNIKWRGGYGLFVLLLSLKLTFDIRKELAESKGLLILVCVGIAYVVLELIKIILKTLYFRRLRIKDRQFFKQNP